VEAFLGQKYFLKNYPNVTVDVVEIDPVVIDVAHKYFNVTENPRLNIYNDDARDFLTKTSNNQKYDIIVLDAFSKNYVPFHLMTLQYYQLLYNKLTAPNGVIVSNQVGSLARNVAPLALLQELKQNLQVTLKTLLQDRKLKYRSFVRLAPKTLLQVRKDSKLE
jgi:spermidine synthase